MSYVDHIINSFGGVRAMARAIEKPASTVSSWKARKSIPDEHKPSVLNISDKEGLGLSPSDFFPAEQNEAAQ